jgi:thiol:disulfide interchange protein DsbC
MRIRFFSALFAGLSVLANAMAIAAEPHTPAMTPTEQAVQQRFSQRFDKVPVDGVSLTPYGLYEVRLEGAHLVYTDEKVSFVIDGNLIDAKTRRDVTSERKEQLLAVRFNDLPLNLALKQVRGNGSRRVALFEDPNCGYCKQLRHSIEGIDNVTIYTFLYPILASSSTSMSQAIWCSPDAAKVWDDWMAHGKPLPAAGGCNAPVAQWLALGRKLNVTGTPTIIFGDNTRVSGAISAERFRQMLDGNKG